MKKLLALAVSVAFLGSSISMPAFAADKAGSSCKKAGLTSISSGKKLTCTKSGKKLVWSKGVSVTKPATNTSQVGTPKTSSAALLGSQCKTQGDTASEGEKKLVCRLVAGGVSKYFELSNGFSTATNPKSPDSLTTCRLPDKRPTPVEPADTSITFPITPRHGSVKVGSEKIAVVGFDFSDSPGQGSPLDVYGKTMEQSQEFFKWYSNGKVKFEFTTHDKWIRLSKPSSSYETGEHFTNANGALSVNQIASEVKSAISKHIDLTGFASIWFVYPRNTEKITENFGLAGSPSIYGFGPNNYLIEKPLWTYFIHEMLHDQGLQGHSPKETGRFGVMLNGNGYTSGLNSWDELSMDWITEDEIYCIDKRNLKPVQIELAPIERQQSGVHSIMVKLDDHRALVLESHRQGEFAGGMPDYGYGVTIQLVDTTKVTYWDENAGATSQYLKISNNQRWGTPYGTPINNSRANQRGVNLFNGIGVSGARYGVNQEYLLLEGESYQFEGITIKFEKSGNTDRISLNN